MKITVTVNDGSKIATLDLYPSVSVLYLKIGTQNERREVSEAHMAALVRALTEEPLQTLIELTGPIQEAR